MTRTRFVRVRLQLERLEARDVPSFLPPVSYAAGVGPRQPVIADLNADGRRDVVIALQYSDRVAVFLGDGTGALGSPTFLVTEDDPWGVEVADVDLNGTPDLVVANLGGNWDNPNVSVFLGNGDGTFAPKVDFGIAPGPLRVAVGDLNGDGNPDIGAAIWGEYQVASVLLGNGDGTFQPYFNYPVGTWSTGVDIGDVDNDGIDDLTVGAGGVHVFYSSGLDASYCCGGANWAGHTLGDLNRDGYLDFVGGHTGNATHVWVALNRGDGVFRKPTKPTTGASPAFPVIADFNRDRKQDVATVNRGQNSVSILLGNGDGTFQPQVVFAVSTYEAFNMSVGDMNNDRRPDLVLPDVNGEGVQVLLNDGMWAPPIPPPGPGHETLQDSHPTEAQPIGRTIADIQHGADALTIDPTIRATSFIPARRIPASARMLDVDTAFALLDDQLS